MNYKATILALALLTLTACGHLRSGPDSASLPEPIPEVGPIERPPLINPEPEEIVLSDAEEAAAEAAPAITPNVPVTPIDVFERMRRGFEFPTLNSKHVAEYERWDAKHPTYLTNLFVRATPFLHHIVDEIDKRGLPMELALLPAVESAYKPEAVSRSRAGGLWQFIPSTGRQFGLRQDWWYDGRRDPLASTSAALDYLEKLNKMFDGDWFLTLAAYNAGPGTVMREMKRSKSRRTGTDYSSLRLRSETRRYVPKLIALKNIIQNPPKYDITLPKIASQPYFEVVELPGQIDLNKFAKDAEIELSLLRHLNAGFKRWATSPDGPHRLLVPIGNGDMVAHAREIVKQVPQLSYQNHRIAEGDTLSAISNRYGVSVAALRKSNNLRGTNIRAGRDLLVPIRSGGVLLASADSDSKTSQLTHTVRRGDTLWSIARRYKVNLQELLAWNNISRDQILKLNQSLLVMGQKVVN